MRLKQSIKQYRNIKGKYYCFWTANCGESGTFAEEKQQCKNIGVSYRIIKGQFFREVIFKTKNND